MGYTTTFEGRFKIEPALTMEQFHELKNLQEWDFEGRTHYVQWTPTTDGKGLEWDQNEKFYEYVPCLQMIVDRYLKQWKKTLSGTVKFRGESRDDRGSIVVVDNVVTKHESGPYEKGLTSLDTARNALKAIGDLGRDDELSDAKEIAKKALEDTKS